MTNKTPSFLLSFFAVLIACHAILVAPLRAQATRDARVATSDADVGGVLVSPAFSRTQVQAGQKNKLFFTLANPGQVLSSVRLKVLPYLPSEWLYKARYDVPYSQDASAWFGERDIAFNLTPGAKKKQQLNFVVPRQTSGSFWCVLQCTARPAASKSSASLIIDVPVLFTVGRATRPQIKIASPSIEKEFVELDNSRLLMKFPVENHGVGYAVVGVTSKLKDAVSGRVVQSFERHKLNIFPGTKRMIRMVAAAIPDGNYILDFRAQLGSRLLPPVSSRYVVVKGVPKLESEATMMELPPLTFQPAGISLEVPAGSMRSQSLRISNLSDRPLTVDIAPKSLEQTPSGVLGVGSEVLPVGLEVSVTPTFLTIRPRSSATARVSVRADKTAQGDLWFGLSINERGNANALAETVNGNVSVAGTAKPMMEIIDGKVDIVNERPLGVRFVVRNAGNQALQLIPSAAVLENGIRPVARLEIPVEGSGGILPSVELPNMVMLPPDLKPGNYIVEISYHYGEELYAKLRVPLEVAGEKAPAAPPAKAPLKAPMETPSKIPAPPAKTPPKIEKKMPVQAKPVAPKETKKVLPKVGPKKT